MSARAIQTLQQVDRIYAEDTRHSLPLLRHHGIETRLWTLHEHNEEARSTEIITHLQTGASAALITDAGTPLISDPGFKLVRACQAAGIKVSPVPGACAVTAALCVSGLPTDRFQFVGFPPAKSSARQSWLQPLAQLTHTLVIYESPHRIIDSLKDMIGQFGEQRLITLARELTKRFETLIHAPLGEVLAAVEADANQQKGEFVLVVAGLQPADGDEAAAQVIVDLDKTLSVLLLHLPPKTAAKCAAELCSITKKQAYDRALKLQGR
ncbi:Ribosomal RNA small subunit methyltransferase I [Granulosicoccus antarcticus IMCC3135]|uniref:Ribosomal RNA small subunit methyltransferase I n=2 Tax=Granulosicoccus TaxID=437504 RepID=A0A2Z2P144_9GAMM|nr:Ribosomal RNA small subunit methyltransferase I [Granulosicoccus antarcticus IMCC3135]